MPRIVEAGVAEDEVGAEAEVGAEEEEGLATGR